MDTYNSLSDGERRAIELAIAALGRSVPLANDDRAARAAEALANYIVDSRGPTRSGYPLHKVAPLDSLQTRACCAPADSNAARVQSEWTEAFIPREYQ